MQLHESGSECAAINALEKQQSQKQSGLNAWVCEKLSQLIKELTFRPLDIWMFVWTIVFCKYAVEIHSQLVFLSIVGPEP